MTGLEDYLSPRQSRRLHDWFGPVQLVADLSWPDTDTLVLQLDASGTPMILKAGGATNHHFDRELGAHLRYTAALVQAGLAARLQRYDPELRMLVLDYLHGRLSEGTAAEYDPHFHQQAGMALRLLHSSTHRTGPHYEEHMVRKTLHWLDRPHGIPAELVNASRRRLELYRCHNVDLVPTHGDWQPRNWIVDDGRFLVIDFGRFDFRPAETDLARLAAQQWRGHPELEQAFLAGYRSDPRTTHGWPMTLLQEAVGTAVYGHATGDEPFAAQGVRMVAEALEAF